MSFKDINEENSNMMKILNDNEELLDKMSETLAESFKGYPLFEYFLNNKYSVEKIKKFIRIMIEMGKGKYLCVANGEDVSSVAIFAPPQMKEPSIVDYLKNGGFQIIKTFGINQTIKMLKFNSFAEKIKKKYINDHCSYLYFLGVKPGKKGQGLARKTITPVLDLLDEKGMDCYLETLDKKNVEIYSRFGFKKVEEVRVPGTDMILYALFRESSKLKNVSETQNELNKQIDMVK